MKEGMSRIGIPDQSLEDYLKGMVQIRGNVIE
jgi:hypothetical protein